MSGDADLLATLAATDAKAAARMARISGQVGFAHAPRVTMVLDLAPETRALAADLARQEGALAFAVMPAQAVHAAVRDILGPDWDARAWDVYEAAPETLLPRAGALAAGLDPGWRAEAVTDPDAATVLQIARLNVACGVSPNAGSALRGEICPIVTSALYCPDGHLRASATVQMMFPEGSRLAGVGFLGLIGVHPEMRGRGLGKIVTAAVLRHSHAALGWRRMSAWVAPDNPASVALMGAFGLRARADAQAFVAMPGGARFTR